VTVNVYEPSEILFRKQLREALAGLGGGTTAGFASVRFTPITTAERTALTDIEGLTVFDGDLQKLFLGTTGGWEEVISV
jgi:hypothetical protein